MTLAEKIAKASIAVGTFAADKKNTEQNYDYISADQVLSRAGDALAKEGIALIPSVMDESTEAVEYTNKYNKLTTRYDARITFNMVLTDGEQTIESIWSGRGSDYATPDKALYKAITSGHKYFLMKLLNIGIGNEDGEHESAKQELPAIEYPPELAVVTNAQGIPYVTLDDDKLGHMLRSINAELKKQHTDDELAEYSMKAETIRKIQELRR